MKGIEKKDKRSDLEKERDEAVKLLKAEIPGSDDYVNQLSIVERLNKLVMDEKDRKKTVSPDTIVNGTVGMLQVMSILFKEQFGVVASKAIGFVKKPR